MKFRFVDLISPPSGRVTLAGNLISGRAAPSRGILLPVSILFLPFSPPSPFCRSPRSVPDRESRDGFRESRGRRDVSLEFVLVTREIIAARLKRENVSRRIGDNADAARIEPPRRGAGHFGPLQSCEINFFRGSSCERRCLATLRGGGKKLANSRRHGGEGRADGGTGTGGRKEGRREKKAKARRRGEIISTGES